MVPDDEVIVKVIDLSCGLVSVNKELYLDNLVAPQEVLVAVENGLVGRR